MRIGIVTTWFERGAAYVSKQFKEVWEKENDIFIYARGGELISKNDSNWTSSDITYGKRYNYSILDIIDLKHFENWIKSKNLDIVFFNEQHLWGPVLLCQKLNIKTGAYIDYYTQQTVPFFGIYDFLICNTKKHLSVFDWHNQIYYIPWGTNTDIYNTSQRKKLDKNNITFFHSAGMNPYRKGTDLVIKAFEQLDSNQNKLIIHTQTNIFNFFPEIKKIINKLKKKGKLQIIQKTVSAPGLYHLGDVYVYPSRLEGIGLTLAEASACAMPVITTNNAPMNEFIINNINGKLVKVKSYSKRKDGYFWEESEVDINDLTTQMKFYSKNLNKLDLYKDKSFAFAEKKLCWKKNSKKLNDILYKIKVSKKKYNPKVFDEIQKYENSRGYWYYFANTTYYQKLKNLLLNTLKIGK